MPKILVTGSIAYDVLLQYDGSFKDALKGSDLEKAVDLQKLEAPEQTLEPLKGLVVIDEVQRKPELFETLRVLLDRPDVPAKFLLP